MPTATGSDAAAASPPCCHWPSRARRRPSRRPRPRRQPRARRGGCSWVDDNRDDRREHGLAALGARAPRSRWSTTAPARLDVRASVAARGRAARHRHAGHGRARVVAAACARRSAPAFLSSWPSRLGARPWIASAARHSGFDHHVVKPVGDEDPPVAPGDAGLNLTPPKRLRRLPPGGANQRTGQSRIRGGRLVAAVHCVGPVGAEKGAGTLWSACLPLPSAGEGRGEGAAGARPRPHPSHGL
jgi:hypothetical protein